MKPQNNKMTTSPLLGLIVFALLLVVVPPTNASTVRNSDRWDIFHPLEEGLWSKNAAAATSQSMEDSIDADDDRLQEKIEDMDVKFEGLRNALRLAEIDSLRLCSQTPDGMQPLNYEIFKTGQSALRRLDSNDRHLVLPQTLFGLRRDIKKTLCRPAHYRACAALLLLRGYSDAAHEVLLGVTMDNLKEGEYAASHRGQTNWAQEHPLTDSADILHAAIHRIVEGNDLGEGDQTGYENAKYWLAGGPKLLERPKAHPVRESLARIAKEHAPLSVTNGGVIASQGIKHDVPSGGGATRTVCVPCGQWDDYAFLDLCRKWANGALDKDLEDEVATLQRAEIILLLRYELMDCLGRHQ